MSENNTAAASVKRDLHFLILNVKTTDVGYTAIDVEHYRPHQVWSINSIVNTEIIINGFKSEPTLCFISNSLLTYISSDMHSANPALNSLSLLNREMELADGKCTGNTSPANRISHKNVSRQHGSVRGVTCGSCVDYAFLYYNLDSGNHHDWIND